MAKITVIYRHRPEERTLSVLLVLRDLVNPAAKAGSVP